MGAFPYEELVSESPLWEDLPIGTPLPQDLGLDCKKVIPTIEHTCLKLVKLVPMCQQ